MLNVGGLLSAATGALEGVQQNRDVAARRALIAQQQQRANLMDLAHLSQVPGFSVGGAPDAPAPGSILGAAAKATAGAPAAPAGPAGAPLGVPTAPAPAPPALNDEAAASTPDAPAPAASVLGAAARALPADAPTPVAALTPAPARQRVGALGGQDVYFNPSLTPTGMRQAALGRDRAAYDQLHAAHPGEYPSYEVGGGYEHLAAAVEPQHVAMATALAALKDADGKPRYTPEESQALAHFNEWPALKAAAQAGTPPKIDRLSTTGVDRTEAINEDKADANAEARQRYPAPSRAGAGRAANPLAAQRESRVASDKELSEIGQQVSMANRAAAGARADLKEARRGSPEAAAAQQRLASALAQVDSLSGVYAKKAAARQAGSSSSASASSNSSSSASKPTITADQAAFLKSQKGWTDAQVQARYSVGG